MKSVISKMLAVLIALMLVVPVGAAPNGPNGAVASDAVSVYIVQLKDEPLPAYKGGIAGLQATSLEATGGEKLDVNTPASVRYINYLKSQQARFLTSAAKAAGHDLDVLFQYQLALNGVAVRLTAAEAAAIAKLDGVKAVVPDWVEYAPTDAGPTWIGADEIWDGTASGGVATKGEGMIIGIIDTGINMDHPSFADVGGDGYNHTNPRGKLYGWCDVTNTAVYTTAVTCNDKLIGVWSFDSDLPEDYNGHGSHVGSTAAGNVITAVMQAPTTAITRAISGVAPHANLIAYSIEGVPGAGTAPGSTIAAAFEQAIADGVDVINYSFGGTGVRSPWTTEGLMTAYVRMAGIFMATSAGNSGPGYGTVSNKPAPWEMVVANSTHNRNIENALIDMTGGTGAPDDMIGKGFTTGYGPAPIVYAGWYANESILLDTARMCLEPFPAGTFDGEIVVCDRGINARVDKGYNVLVGGAGGMVLLNNAASGGSLSGDAHYLPAVHLTYAQGVTLMGWLTNTVAQTATIMGYNLNLDAANGDIMAANSSRGPSLASPTLLKPDVTAPGTDILAAVADGDNEPDGEAEFDFYSGTSMASPHVAGAAALVRKLHPDWSVSEAQSALMSTAFVGATRPVKEDGVTLADPFDIGAGRVDVAKAVQAGFVLHESTGNMWYSNPAWGGNPVALNLASLADPACVEQCVWTRTISSTMDSTVTWTVTAAGHGFTMTVEPASFALAPFGTQVVTITADVSAAAFDAWLFGQVVFTPDTAETVAAHFPAAVMRDVSNIPAQIFVATDQVEGSQSLPGLKAIEIVTATIDVHGITQGALSEAFIIEDPTLGDPTDVISGGVYYYTVTVASTDMRLVAEVIATTSPDLDMFIFNRNGAAACTSATGAALEYCSISGAALITGTYHIFIQNYESSSGTATIPDRVVVATAVVPMADAGTLDVTAPTSVAAGELFTGTVTWDVSSYATNTFGINSYYWYGAFDSGTEPAQAGNLGRTLVNLVYTPKVMGYIYLPLVMRSYLGTSYP